MFELLGASALLGLVGSPHCVGMCGPFALSCGGRGSQLFAWQAGKLTTYAALGAAAGLAGSAIPGPVWLAQAVSAVLVVWFAGALAGWAPEPTLHVPGLTRLAVRATERGDFASRFAFGAANGLLPCGLVYAALGLTVAGGDPLSGALAMITFGLGTAPLVTTFALTTRRLMAERPWARQALAMVILVLGLMMVLRRGGMMPPTP